jgi:hypothetical protein
MGSIGATHSSTMASNYAATGTNRDSDELEFYIEDSSDNEDSSASSSGDELVQCA